jgi:DNA gyrase inhibitor GyrI
MNRETVQIVALEPMRVVSAREFGPEPESAAWQKLESWSRPHGLLKEPGRQRIFGFNNPNPAPGSPNYGYEYWLTVGSDFDLSDGGPNGIRVQEFPGGLYAVLEVDPATLGDNFGETIPAAWQRLNAWVAEHGYRQGAHQWLEEHNSAGLPFAFYYPIVE